MYDAILKNEMLVADLTEKRQSFAGIGTNKAKRRLNKLAAQCSLAQAVRLALEIEDKSICAKKYRGPYKDKIYEEKSELIEHLATLFEEQGWAYGVQKSDIVDTSHVVYFEIPGCEQISWHFSPSLQSDMHSFPAYKLLKEGVLA